MGHDSVLPVLGVGKCSSRSRDLDRPRSGKNLRDLVDFMDLLSGSERKTCRWLILWILRSYY